MANLAQYRGRTVEGQKRALANLTSREKSHVSETATPPELSPQLPVPVIPTDRPPVAPIDAMRVKYLRVCLTKEEYDLYLLNWKDWFEGHPDYVMIEDRLDVETICMETVNQFRINMMRQRYPNRDYDNSYNQSYRRMQQARDNLAARRDIRTGVSKSKDGSHLPAGAGTVNIGNMNVAVMSGSVDEKKLLALQQESRRQQLSDLDMLKHVGDTAKQLMFIDEPSKDIPGAQEVLEGEVVGEQ